jgi:hypothetical protein
MAGLNCNLSVTGVRDVQGNFNPAPVNLVFAGSVVPDQIPPAIASRSPAPGATAVTLEGRVVIHFSEPVAHPHFTWTSSEGAVSFSWGYGYIYPGFGTTYDLHANRLEKNTKYTITASFGTDLAGNVMSDTQWSFTTLYSSDSTPPRLVSSTPANLATNVDINADFSLTFSEAISDHPLFIDIGPSAGDASYWFSDDGKTLTYDPQEPLLEDQQYTLTMLPGIIQDRAGNTNTAVQTLVFTTGSMIGNGSIAGTISGDPGSAAADPTGGILVAASQPYFDEYAGITTVAVNNTYSVSHLPDGTYYSMAVLDTNKDGYISAFLGDAIGVYGITSFSGLVPEPVTIANGQHVTGINFHMLDPVSLRGSVAYSGTHAHDASGYQLKVGLFDTAGWSAAALPVARGFGRWPDLTEWRFNQFYQRFPDGDYYVGAFLDLDDDDVWNSGVEPAGMYGAWFAPKVVHVTNGNDIQGIVIEMVDPAPTTSALSVTWPAPNNNEAFNRMCDGMDRYQSQMSSARSESRKTALMK